MRPDPLSIRARFPRRSELRGSSSRLAALGAAALGVVVALATVGVSPAGAHPEPFLADFNTVATVASTIPGNGDVNPYGIANVPQSIGSLVRGDTLVSNFNAVSNLQGTGTTIVQISPKGQQSLFAQIGPSLPGACPGGVGLTTALAVLRGGFVVVGSLPANNATGTPEAGCLIVLDSHGTPVETFAGGDINGPWDMTAFQIGGFAELFVTNVLNGTVAANPVPGGTVVRLVLALPPGRNPVLLDSKVIGSGFDEQLNSTALVIGPTGVALGPNGTLYVADTLNNRIAAIPLALFRQSPVGGGGLTVTSGGALSGPLGLTTAPNGDLIAANGGNGNAVEVTPGGAQVDSVQIDPAGLAGNLFGLTIAPTTRGLLFVDDGDNTLKLFDHAGGY